MKKTEKLEIRMAAEEKEALARAADDDGRTASDVVRAFVSAYVADAARRNGKDRPMSPLRPVFLLLIGAAIAGPAGFVAARALAPSPELTGLEMAFSLHTADPSGPPYQFEAVLSARTPHEAVQRIPIDAASAYRVTTRLDKTPSAAFMVSVDVCRETGEACAPIAEPKLVFEPAIGESSNMTLSGSDAGRIRIRFRPVFTRA